MRTKVNRHTHTLIRSGDMWKCADGDCRFFMYERQAKKVLPGRNSICTGCKQTFRFRDDNFDDDLPLCQVCKFPEPDDVPDLDKMVEERIRLANQQ